MTRHEIEQRISRSSHDLAVIPQTRARAKFRQKLARELGILEERLAIMEESWKPPTSASDDLWATEPASKAPQARQERPANHNRPYGPTAADELWWAQWTDRRDRQRHR
jgi:hypothetical protein